jgi:hypothetical protein
VVAEIPLPPLVRASSATPSCRNRRSCTSNLRSAISVLSRISTRRFYHLSFFNSSLGKDTPHRDRSLPQKRQRWYASRRCPHSHSLVFFRLVSFRYYTLGLKYTHNLADHFSCLVWSAIISQFVGRVLNFGSPPRAGFTTMCSTDFSEACRRSEIY